MTFTTITDEMEKRESRHLQPRKHAQISIGCSMNDFHCFSALHKSSSEKGSKSLERLMLIKKNVCSYRESDLVESDIRFKEINYKKPHFRKYHDTPPVKVVAPGELLFV